MTQLQQQQQHALIFPVLALLIGSAATLIPKVLLRTPCDSSCSPVASGRGSSNQFSAPLWATSVVFIAAVVGWLGESSVNAIRARSATADAAADKAVVDDDDHKAMAATPPTSLPPRSWRRFLVLVLPGTLNVGSVLLQLLSLTLIPAAALAGLRGLLILFTALLSASARLKDAPKSLPEWLCVGGSAAGALLVGAAAWLQSAYNPEDGAEAGASPASSSAATAGGLGLAALGYAFAAAQVTLEQLLLEGRGLSKWEIMGGEGAWGGLVCGAIGGGLWLSGWGAAAGSSAPLESPSHTLCCLRTTPALPILSTAYGGSSLAFNFTLLVLAASMGANWRVFIFTARGLITWGVEAALSYCAAPLRAYGEALSPFSALLLLGYALLIGTGLLRVRLGAAAGAGGQQQQQSASGKEEEHLHPQQQQQQEEEAKEERGEGSMSAPLLREGRG